MRKWARRTAVLHDELAALGTRDPAWWLIAGGAALAWLATAADPLGGCVVTVIDDGRRAAITLCGSGLAGTGSRGHVTVA